MSYLESLKQTGNAVEPKPLVLSPPKLQVKSSPGTATREPALMPALPQSILVDQRPLATLCRVTLDGNPAAAKLSKDERRWIAEHLEAAVLSWLVHVFKPEYAWEATCSKGHHLTDGIFARCLLGWSCEGCKTVHRPEDCKLEQGHKD
jgi:hypothetical protein